MSDGTSRCCTCKKVKPKDKFYSNIARKSGVSQYCKSCERARGSSTAVKNQPARRKQWGDKMADFLDLDGSDY